ncbi:hypothetical protein AB0D97_12615 [Streptomyces roseus]|uniref:hypothetical protein n=1 Tax=Streptomyces roseus TaxID=66430 RepID=UPI0033FCFC6D
MPASRHAAYRAINRMRIARQAAHLAIHAAGRHAKSVQPDDVITQGHRLSGLHDGPLTHSEAAEALAYYHKH